MCAGIRRIDDRLQEPAPNPGQDLLRLGSDDDERRPPGLRLRGHLNALFSRPRKPSSSSR
jgi:hypothetical protein